MSPDPALNTNAVVLPENWNRYAYVGGDPINKTDPRGLCSPNDDPPCYDITVISGSWGGGGGGGGGGGTDPNGPSLEAPPDGWPSPVIIPVSVSAQTVKVVATLASLRNALNSDQDCLSFLESGIAGNDTKTFNAFYNALMGVNSSAPLAGAVDFTGTDFNNLNGVTNQPSTGFFISVNTTGAFFTTNRGVGYADVYASQVQNIQPATQQAQYFILLHELAHFFQVQGFIQNDGNNLGAQESNNDKIWKNCQKTIQGGSSGVL